MASLLFQRTGLEKTVTTLRRPECIHMSLLLHPVILPYMALNAKKPEWSCTPCRIKCDWRLCPALWGKSSLSGLQMATGSWRRLSEGRNAASNPLWLCLGERPFAALVGTGRALDRLLGTLAIDLGEKNAADPCVVGVGAAQGSERALVPGLRIFPPNERTASLRVEGSREGRLRAPPVLAVEQIGKRWL